MRRASVAFSCLPRRFLPPARPRPRRVRLGGAAVVVVLVLFDELRLATFDHVHAEQVGVRVELVQGVLVLLLAVVVIARSRPPAAIPCAAWAWQGRSACR